jgi:hypothetical protein
MRRWLLAVLALLVAGLVPAQAAGKDMLPSGVEWPVKVRVGLRVLNVLKVEEVAGQARLHLELTQRWRDPRLSFDPLEQGLNRIDRVGEDADEFLKANWRPGLVIDNQVDDADSRSVALSVYANGDAVLIERFESNFRFRMNMDAFPFDKQELALVLSLPRYAKQEALLVNTEADRLNSGVEPVLSVVDWAPTTLRFTSEEGMGWNARSYSRLNATLTLARHSERYVLRIFVPILAVLAVSIFVLWSPGLKEESKGSLIFSSLLALAAISFTFESSFPGSISLNTPIAQMISLGYLYLVVVLMLEIMLASPIENASSRFHGIALEARRQIKWALPVIMVAICIGAAVRALPA